MRTAISSVVTLIVLTLLIGGCGGDMPTAPTTSMPFQFSLTPTTIPAGSSSEGSIAVSSSVHDDITIRLTSSDGAALVPPFVTLHAASLRTSFTVTTRLVAADTAAKISASIGDTKQEITLQVVSPVAKPPTLDTLVIDTPVVRAGQNAQGTVRLTAPAPAGGLLVLLRSSNSAAIVPVNLSVQAGSLIATFPISTRPVDIDTQFEITASYSDQTRTVPFRVTP